MKARLFKIKNHWYAIIPPHDLFEEEEIPNEQYAVRYAMNIYNLPLIKNKEHWKNNSWVEGDLKREGTCLYFEILGVEYINIDSISSNENKVTNSPTLILIQGLLSNKDKSAITIEQYNLIQSNAKQEGIITAYMENGFCINHRYLIYGKLTKEKRIIYPQIKIKK